MQPTGAYILSIAALDNLSPAQEAYRQASADVFHAHALMVRHATNDLCADWQRKFEAHNSAWLALSTEEQDTFRV